MKERTVKDWSKETKITLEQYMYIRNGMKRSATNIISSLTDEEFIIFGIEKKKGWAKKYAKVPFPVEKAKSAAKAAIRFEGMTKENKSALRRSFFTGDYDKKFLYLIENSVGMTKIGISIDPIRRVNQLSTASGYSLNLKAYWRLKDSCSTVEAKLHKEFAGSRLEGEWFRSEDICADEIEKYLACEFERVYDAENDILPWD